MILYVNAAANDEWDFRREVPDENQPSLVRLAWLLEADDGTLKDQACHIVSLPPGVRMASNAAFNTGIFDHHIRDLGMTLDGVLEEFTETLGRASLVVGHAWEFQKRILDKSFRLLGKHTPNWRKTACAMLEATDIVKIPSDRPGYAFKRPSFAQCYQQFCGGQLIPLVDPKQAGIQRVEAVRLFWHNILRHKERFKEEERLRTRDLRVPPPARGGPLLG